MLVALGLKKVLEYVSDLEKHTLVEPLKGVGLAALFGGIILYLLAHVLFKWLTVHAVSVVRLGASAGLLVAWLAVGPVPALGQLIIAAVDPADRADHRGDRLRRPPATGPGRAVPSLIVEPAFGLYKQVGEPAQDVRRGGCCLAAIDA